MSARDEFIKKLTESLLVEVDEETARRVATRIVLMMTWSPVRREYEEIDLTTLGDAEARIRWSFLLVGKLKVEVESGEYRKPLASGWTVLP